MSFRCIILCLFVLTVAAGWLLLRSHQADDVTPVAYLPWEDRSGEGNLGKKIANIAFSDADGKTTQLYDIKDKKAIVLVLLSFECPVSISYMQPLADLARQLEERGVAFVGLTTNQDETSADVAQHVKEFKLPFPVVVDRKLAGADAVAATRTPEVFVLDGGYVLRYRGRIDDGYYARFNRNRQVTRQDLRQALDEILSGRPVSISVTTPVGCPIYRPATLSLVKGAGSKGRDVTFHKDVLPILQKHCQECHRPGAMAPFALVNYRQAVNWATDIKAYTQSHRMPPWKVDAGLPFRNERRMSDQEIAVLAAWVDSGMTEGNPKDGPPQIGFFEGWKLGVPDLVLAVADDYKVGPTGNDVFRCFVLPTNLTEDKSVQAVEVKPGNPRIVHHALLFIDTAGKGRELEHLQQKVLFRDPHGGNELDKGPGYYGGMGIGFLPAANLGGWAPGQLPRTLPDGTAFRLPRESDIVVQMHYHRNGRLERDRTSIGLYYSKKHVTREYQGEVLTGAFQTIPAGNERFVVKGAAVVTEDMILYDVMPHMHMVGKQIKVTMTPPTTPLPNGSVGQGGGEATLLFHIKDWDFNWQETYVFKEPLQLKAGTRLDLEAIFDNSANNPNNPFKPPRQVTLGEQTFNEMCNVYLGGTSDRQGPWLPLTAMFIKKTQE